jgi:hypothetical protein
MPQKQMPQKQKGLRGGGLHSHNNSRLYVNPACDGLPVLALLRYQQEARHG